MTTDPDEQLPLPEFVTAPNFPFEGDLRVRRFNPPSLTDRPRSGEPGGDPCDACSRPDGEYIWVDDHWRVFVARRSGVPLQLFLETRDHLDLDDLDNDRGAELGLMIVRLNKAMQAIGGIGRVHASRWGDGGSHFHMWFYSRPVGASQMLGFWLPMWAIILPATDQETWDANAAIVARELAAGGGRSMLD